MHYLKTIRNALQLPEPISVDGVLALEVEQKKTEQILLRAKVGAICASFGVGFTAWVAWPYSATSSLIGWIASITIPDLLTFITASRFSRHGDNTRLSLAGIRFWQRRQSLLQGLAGLGWGLAPAFLLTANMPIAAQLMIYITVATVITFAMTTMANSPYTIFIFPLCVIIPTEIYLLNNPNDYRSIIAIATPIVGLISMIMGWTVHKMLTAQIQAIVLSEDLSRALKQANAMIEEKNDALNKKNEVLTETLAKLDRLANMDELTGLHNRRYVLKKMEEISLQVKLHNKPCSIAIIDIDHFKAVNDVYGHGVGDQVLQAFSRHMLSELRKGDFIARYGGEEFLMLLPYASEKDALAIMERIRHSVPDPLINDDHIIPVHFSCGVTQIQSGESIASCINRADDALYQAKEKGRNQVISL